MHGKQFLMPVRDMLQTITNDNICLKKLLMPVETPVQTRLYC